MFNVFRGRAAASPDYFGRPVRGVFAIGFGILRVCVNPANFLIRIADVAISDQREIFSF